MVISIITPAGVNIHIPGKGMKNIPTTSPIYQDVVDVLMDGLDLPPEEQLEDAEKIHRILRLIDREAPIRNSVNNDFEIIDGNIKVDGEFVPVVIAKRIMDFINNKYDYRSVLSFWKRLRNNPSERSRVELLSFLEQMGIPLTDDGHFVAYKYVNSDYSSVHDRSYNNSPGNILSKRREDCDSDSSQTCSRGLHVASWNYVKNQSTIVAVKVDPIDVVSVPYDYNGEKMRVCRYKVLENITGEFTLPRYDDNPTPELSEETFEYMTIVGRHSPCLTGKGGWNGKIIHKNALLNDVVYSGKTLTELHENFVKLIDDITKDTRFNYLRQRRNGAGGFIKAGA